MHQIQKICIRVQSKCSSVENIEINICVYQKKMAKKLKYYRVSIFLKTIITSGSLTRSSSTRFGWLGKCFFANDLRQARYFSCITSNVGLLRSIGQKIDQSVKVIIEPWLIRLDKYLTLAIITRGLYIFYPIFLCGIQLRAVNITDNLCAKQGNVSMKSMVYNQERVIMACVLIKT